MFGLDRAWWLIPVILVIVLIIWGPGRMPDVGAGLGRAIREFRNAVSGVRDTVVDATQMPTGPTPPANPYAESPVASARPAASQPAPSEQPPASNPAPSEQPPATVPDDTRR